MQFNDVQKTNAIVSRVVLSGLLLGLMACKVPAQTKSADIASSGNGNIAQYIFYRCRSATLENSVQRKYETSFFNNTSKAMSLQHHFSPNEPIRFADLKRTANDQWTGESKFKTHLTNKADGSKGIEVFDPHIGRVVNKENSTCEIRCSGPTQQVENRCLWSGKTDDDEIGNFIIETVATLGTSAAFRVATIGTSRGVLFASDSAFRTGAHIVSRTDNYDEAIAAMGKAIEKTNPLTGTKVMGRGNCANDAMTQLVSLVLGRWACAIPYPAGHPDVASSVRIWNDLSQLFGIRQQFTNIRNLSGFAEKTMLNAMKDGQVAVLLSGAKDAGHMTLIAKIKGQLVHINNQSWPVKFQSVADWEKLWTSTYGKINPAYNVFILEKHLLGFR
jgi:hypothetical protein